MNFFSQLLLYAVLALTAENMLFAGGIGLSRALRAARKPHSLPAYAAAVTFFSLLLSLCGEALTPLLRQNDWALFFSPVIFAVLMALFYCGAAILLRQLCPRLYAWFRPILAPAAINCIVLSMPFMNRILGAGWSGAIGFSIGTGLAFLLASLILREAIEAFRDPAVPASFRGLPAALLYTGLFSLAMAGFQG